MSKNRKRRLHADADDDSSDFDSDEDDFDPQELVAVERMLKQRKKENSNGLENEKEEEEEEEEEEQGEEVGSLAKARQQSELRKQFHNNTTGLDSKLSEIALPADWPWIETLSLSTPSPLSLGSDVHDDLKRESIFYATTVAAVKLGIKQLQQKSIPFLRPIDFYSEMIKPDSQMQRIKESLLTERAKITATEERKKNKEQKKIAKSVQQEKLKQKIKEKKNNIETVEQARKKMKMNQMGKEELLFSGKDEENEERRGERSTLPIVNDTMAANRASSEHSKEKRFNKKRMAKDHKFGYGGSKKFVKTNDAQSSADDSGFNSSKNRKIAKGWKSDKPGMTRAQRRDSFTKSGKGKNTGGPGGGAGGGFRNKNGSTFRNRPGKSARASKN